MKISNVIATIGTASTFIFACKYFKTKNKYNKLKTTLDDKNNKHLDFRYKIIEVKDTYKDTAVESLLEKALDEDLRYF